MKINETEGRAVLHCALRAPRSASITVDGQDVVPEAEKHVPTLRPFRYGRLKRLPTKSSLLQFRMSNLHQHHLISYHYSLLSHLPRPSLLHFFAGLEGAGRYEGLQRQGALGGLEGLHGQAAQRRGVHRHRRLLPRRGVRLRGAEDGPGGGGGGEGQAAEVLGERGSHRRAAGRVARKGLGMAMLKGMEIRANAQGLGEFESGDDAGERQGDCMRNRSQVVIISKTFTTAETMLNAKTVKALSKVFYKSSMA